MDFWLTTLLVSCFLGRTTGKLQVQEDHSLVQAAVGDQVLLECIFTTGHDTVDLSRLMVQWFHRGKQLAEFDDAVQVSRPGIRLSQEELMTGNASLLLSQVGAENAGKYRCYITYSPEIKVREVTLEVGDSSQTSEEDLEDSFASPLCLRDASSKLDQILKLLQQLEAKLDGFTRSKTSSEAEGSDADSQQLPKSGIISALH